jgi:hypothetical protein
MAGCSVRGVTEIRIGSPPPSPRRGRWPAYTAAGAIGLTLISGAAVAGIGVARHDRAATPLALSQSSSERPPGSGISELETCYALIPLLSAGAAELTAVLGDPQTTPPELTSTIAGLRTLQATAPQGWRADIGIQADSLQQLYDAHSDHAKIAAIDSAAYGDSGVRLAHGCLPYARP